MTEAWDAKVQRHRELLGRRGSALSYECVPPVGHAAEWFWDLARFVPPSGRNVARQLARLCGDDTELILPIRSLADAVGIADSAGRVNNYAERGVRTLIEAGWLTKEVTGRGCVAETVYRLQPGDRPEPWSVHDEAA